MNKLTLSFLFSSLFLVAGSANAFAIDSEQLNDQNSEQTSYQNSNLGSVSSDSELVVFTQAELEQMLAPIALYPDSLLTHILIAATYPLEVVEAERWVTKNKELSSEDIQTALEDKEWAPSIKALVPFPQVLNRMSEELTWTVNLGDAFLQNEEKLLASIQILRNQAEQAGSLDSMDNMEVSYEADKIIIEPVEKEVIYVPYYDTRIVYGSWHHTYYPPVYWGVSHHYYSPNYVSHYSPFHWGHGVHIGFNFFFSAFHWHNHHVVVVNHHNTHHYRPRSHVVRGGYAKRWHHKPVHRKGIAYRSTKVTEKYRGKKQASFHSKVAHKSRKTHHEKYAKSYANNQVAKSYDKRVKTVGYHAKKNKAYKVSQAKLNSVRVKNDLAQNRKDKHQYAKNTVNAKHSTKYSTMPTKKSKNLHYQGNTKSFKNKQYSREFNQIKQSKPKSYSSSKASKQQISNPKKNSAKQSYRVSNKSTKVRSSNKQVSRKSTSSRTQSKSSRGNSNKKKH